MTSFPIPRRHLMGVAAAAFVAGGHGARADDAAVLTPIRQLIAGLLTIMKAGRATPFQQRFETLGPIIDRTFDLAEILRASIGAAWNAVPANQQAMLQQVFRRYTVASYVNSFDAFEGERFDISPETRPVGNGNQVVQTRIIPRSGGDGHELDYVMHQTPNGWRVVDVLADGAVSRVAVQRSDFRRLLARGGAPALVASLRDKTADLAGGNGA